MRIILPIVVSVVIFWLSSAPGSKSAAQSDFFIELFRYIPFFSHLNGEILSVIVRKLAHTFEYFLLGGTSNWAFSRIGRMKAERLAFIVSVLIAISDEIFQIFVSGRSGAVVDVLVDSVGALLGIAFFTLLMPKSTE